MSFKKEIEQYLERISVLEESFRKVKDLDTLPVSFFSISLDILNQLKIGLYELETLQLNSVSDSATGAETDLLADVETAILTGLAPADKLVESTVLLGDKISKKMHVDLTKSLTINQRFMFLRDLFGGNDAEMNRIFAHLNTLPTLEEALNYLNGNRSVSWETESGIAFKELLEKHFA
jgi:hypothetical protein